MSNEDKILAGAGLTPDLFRQKTTSTSTSNNTSSGPLTQYDLIGITHSGMTNYERYQAVAAYWADMHARGQIKHDYDPIKPEVEGCNCDGAGWYYRVQGHQKTLTKCACGIAGPSPDEQRINRELSVLEHKRFSNFELDRPYVAMPNATVTVQRRMVEIAVDRAKRFAKDPSGWLYIHGSPGTGKSHLAAAIANHVKRGGRWSVMYRSMPALLDLIRDAMHKGAVDTLIQQISDADLLIIDDMGAEGQPTDWSEARIFRIINARVDMPTVFTSNFDVPQLPYHERILDRLNASSRCWINASSMRSNHEG